MEYQYYRYTEPIVKGMLGGGGEWLGYFGEIIFPWNEGARRGERGWGES